MSFSNPLPSDAIGCLQYQWALQYARGESVGGDALFLERVRGDRRALFLLVDVSGHGMPAHLIVRTLRIQLGRDRRLQDLGPSQILARLHQRLVSPWASLGAADRFVGAQAILLDSERACVQVACAGMPHPIRIANGNRSSVIEIPGGPWLGVSDEPLPGYPVTEIPIHAGERLYFCSDGATDARPPNTGQEACLREIGLGRLIETVLSREPEYKLFPVLFGELAELEQSEWPQDDTIVLCIRNPDMDAAVAQRGISHFSPGA